MKLAILGAGRIGRVHADAIAAVDGAELAAIADPIADAAAVVSARHGCDVRSIDAIAASDDVDAVVICTPTDTHADLIERFVAAQKAVFCEKPVDLSLARARACADAVGDAPVMLGFNRRFDPSFVALKRAYDGGEIGRAELLSITSFDPAPPPIGYVRASGGLFRDMAIHDFDVACWIMGGPPERISAAASSLVDPAIAAAGDVDTAVTTLKWADGRLAVIKNSRRAAYGYDQRIELLGARGLLSAANVPEHTVSRATADGVSGPKPMYFFLERYMAAYQAEISAFVDAVRRSAAPAVGMADGVLALAIAEAASASAQEGKEIALSAVYDGGA